MLVNQRIRAFMATLIVCGLAGYYGVAQAQVQVSAQLSSGKVSLAWDDPKNPPKNVEHYNVYYWIKGERSTTEQRVQADLDSRCHAVSAAATSSLSQSVQSKTSVTASGTQGKGVRTYCTDIEGLINEKTYEFEVTAFNSKAIPTESQPSNRIEYEVPKLTITLDAPIRLHITITVQQ